MQKLNQKITYIIKKFNLNLNLSINFLNQKILSQIIYGGEVFKIKKIDLKYIQKALKKILKIDKINIRTKVLFNLLGIFSLKQQLYI